MSLLGLALLSLLISFPVLGQVPAVDGSLYGTILDDKGVPLRGAVLRLSRAAGIPLAKPFLPLSTVSDTNGSFAFLKIPQGLYRVCPSIAGTEFLNPCLWFDDAPAVIVNAGQARAGMQIKMKRGRLLYVRVEDPGLNLQKDSKGVSSHMVAVRAISPRGVHMPDVSVEQNGGQNHVWSVPIGVALRMDVVSPTLDVKGEGEASKLNGGIGISAVVGATPSTFQLKDTDENRQFRFTVQAKGR